MRRLLVTWSAAAVVVATAAGCSSSGVVHSALTANTSPSPSGASTPSTPSSSDNVASKDFSTSTPSTPDTSDSPSGSASSSYGPPPAASTALVARFLPYPSGARPWVKNKTGPLALQEFIESFYVEDAWKDETDLSKQRGMQGVARHGWFNSDDTQSEIYLVKFSAAKGAQDMYNDLLDSWKDKTAPIVPFDDAAIHGKGLVDPTADSQGDTLVKLAFTVGDTFVYVRDYSPATPDKAGTLALALKQYNALKK